MLLSIIIPIISLLLGFLIGRLSHSVKTRFLPFNTITDNKDDIKAIKEAQAKFRTFSPSKKLAEQSLEKQLNQDNI